MRDKMQAAVLYGPHNLKVEEVPIPELKSGEVLIKVISNGLCHTDITIFHANIPEKLRRYPLILGHEACGMVVETAEGVYGIAEGDNVLLPPVYGCGECNYCREGQDNLCVKSVMLGQTRDGAYAEYIAMPAKYVFKIGKEMDFRKACVAADAVSTVYHSLKERVKLRPGDNVAVFGCGGLGLAAINVAKILGANRIFAVDIREESLEAARKLGAEPLNSKGEEEIYKTLKSLTNDQIRVAMDCIGLKSTIEAAFKSICKGGEVGVIGYTNDDVSFKAGSFMGLQKRIGGSWGCPTRLFPEVVKMLEEGKIELDILVSRHYQLKDILQAFEDLESRRIIGRAVIDIY